ncbi:hypothetical protein BDW62DRAFT_36588 [Aspergillus aurantiobrunneus]
MTFLLLESIISKLACVWLAFMFVTYPGHCGRVTHSELRLRHALQESRIFPQADAQKAPDRSPPILQFLLSTDFPSSGISNFAMKSQCQCLVQIFRSVLSFIQPRLSRYMISSLEKCVV